VVEGGRRHGGAGSVTADVAEVAVDVTGRALGLVGLPSLMELTAGDPEVVVGVVDGPVDATHPDLAHVGAAGAAGAVTGCRLGSSEACVHGTLVAGVLVARRGAAAPAICPGCTPVVRPVFSEATTDLVPVASQAQLAEAIHGCVEAGAHLVNVSAGLGAALGGDRALGQVLDLALRRGVTVVASAGNDAGVGGSVLTRHPAVVPVAACDLSGRVLGYSTLSSSIGRRGVLAPGVALASTSSVPGPATISGTSVAAPLVTGTLALLRSLFPGAGAAAVRAAVVDGGRQRALVPRLLDALGAYHRLDVRRT
jgi:subtilisin family serine protease